MPHQRITRGAGGWIGPAVFVAAGVGIALGLGLVLKQAPSSPSAASTDLAPAGSPTRQKGEMPRAASQPVTALADKQPVTARELADKRPAAPGGLLLVQPHPALAGEALAEEPSEPSSTKESAPGVLGGSTAVPAAPEAIPPGSSEPRTLAPPSPLLPQLPPPPQGALPPPEPSVPNGPAVSEAPPTAPPPAPRSRITRLSTPRGDLLSINIQDAEIREVLEMLSQQGGLNILASKEVKGKVSASLVNVDLDSALAAILKSTGYASKREGRFIFVGTSADFEAMARSADRIGTRVYHPNYVTSTELETLIKPVLTKEIGVVSVTTAAEKGIPSNVTDVGGNKYAGTEAVVVRDYEAVLYQVDQLVADVDVRPMQVHIEAMILSVKLDDVDKFGVNFQLLRDNNNLRLGWGTVPSNFAKFTFDGGLKVGFLDENLGAFLDALETVGDTNVIATPRVMVINKQAAEIQIGKKKGYVNTTQTTTAATQTVEFLDLGTILRIRPFISSDGLIRMEVHPEISDGEVKVEQGYTLPNSEVTQVTTNILVRDGCTVVIGGLLQDEQKVTRTQIPLLGNLPVVGFVFRNKKEEMIRTELIVLITPRIVYEPGTCREGDQAACEFQRRQATYAEKMCPISKRSLARKYIRRAKSAWASGDRQEALRLAELAVHFDPVSLEAIELRSDLWLGKPADGSNPEGPAPDEPPTEALDGEKIAPWLLEDLGRESQPLPEANHPLDPGRPGNHRDLQLPESRS